MNKSSVVTFVTISIILLIGVFFVWMIVSFWGSSTDTNVIQPVAKEKPQQQDPLITSAEDVYLSFARKDDPLRGGKDVELIILEFGDYECPYCLQIQESLINILAKFEGRVGLVWKDFPSPSHPQARLAAVAARCAEEQGKFWEYHDYLFVNQDQLSRELYNRLALELDLDLPLFNNCLETQKYIKKIGQGLEDGQRLGVDATPYLFIGNTVIDFAADGEQIEGVIRKELGG